MIEVKNLKDLMIEQDLDEAYIAHNAGYSYQTVYNVMRGARGTNMNTIECIVEALGYDLVAVPKGMFDGFIVRFTTELPKMVHNVMEPDFVAEFGESNRSEKPMLVVHEDGYMCESYIYQFEDGRIESDEDRKVKAWMQVPKVRL